MLIPKSIGDVAEIAALAPDASATVEAAGGNSMVWAGVGAARKGKPFTVIHVTKQFEAILGKALHMSKGKAAESYRHIRDAVVGGNGKFVRVVPDTARYPVLTLRKKVDGEDKDAAVYNTHGTAVAVEGLDAKYEMIQTALPYGTDIVPNEAADLFSIYLDDGDNDLERSITIKKLDATQYGDSFYSIELFEKSAQGITSSLEEQIVSFDVEAKDVNSNDAFIDDVLAESSLRMKSVTNADLADDAGYEVAAVKFDGGTSGNLSDLTSKNYEDGVKVLREKDPTYHGICALGCYHDTALQELKKLADDARVSFYYDIEPNLSYAAALTRQKALGITGKSARCYHLPYTAKDPFSKGRISWGLSGFAFAAKAAGVASRSPVGGWHIVPAGQLRATLNRSGLQINDNAGIPDYEAMVLGRINKIGKNRQGLEMIDDCLTCHPRNDYLRFDNVASVTDAFDRDWYMIANEFKHEPEDMVETALTNAMTRRLEQYQTSGCIAEGWTFELTMISNDLWKAEWGYQVGGVFRRGTGQCKLLPVEAAA